MKGAKAEKNTANCCLFLLRVLRVRPHSVHPSHHHVCAQGAQTYSCAVVLLSAA